MQNPEVYGKTTGQILVCLILIAGLTKCWTISRRPTTNAKCVFGLGFVLLGWFIASLATIVTRWLPFQLQGLLTPLLGLLMIGCLITAVIISIIGLYELKDKRDVFTQGKSQAIWALVLTGLFMIPVTAGIYKSASGRTTIQNSLLAVQPVDNKLRFDPFNFEFKIPDKSWVVVDKEKFNPAATLVLMRGNPQALLMVVAEKAGIESHLTEAGLLETVKATMLSGSPTATFKQKPTIQAGMKGVELEVEWEMANVRYYGVQTVFYHNGYAYQLLLRGYERNRDYIRKEANQLFASFSLIEPDRVAHVEGLRAPETFESPFGYEVKIARPGWTKWPNMATDAPQADYGILYKNSGALTVIPVFLFDFDPDSDAVLEAGLSRLGIVSTDENFRFIKKWETFPGMSAALYSYERGSGDDEFFYKIVIARHQRYAYVISAWHTRKDLPSPFFLDDALKQVRFLPTTSLRIPKEGTFSLNDVRRHALFFNDLGLYHYKAQLFDKSLPYFETAFQFEDKNKVFLRNIIDACIQTKDFARGREQLDKATAMASLDEFKVMHAYLQGETGMQKEALENYNSAFSNGYRHDEYFEEYLSLLFNQGEFETASSRIEKYLEAKESVRIRLWQAMLYRQSKQFDKAIALMEAQSAKHPSNTEITLSLWESYHGAERDVEALKLCEQLLARGRDSANTYFLKGRSELALKHYREAKESFETALKKKPFDPDTKTYLDHVSGILGEGDNSAVKTMIAAVPIPEMLLTNAPQLEASVKKEYGAHYELFIDAISYEKDKEQKSTEFARVRVHDASGVSKFSSLQFNFDPLSEEVFVNELIVKDAQGKIVSTGNVSDFYVVDEGGDMATQNKTLHVPISGLQPGYSVEWRFTRRDFGKPETFRYYSHTLSKYYPASRSIIFLRGDVDAVKHLSSPGISAMKIADGIFWQQDQPLVYRFEPLQQSYDNYLPMIWLGDSQADWTLLATNYLETIKDRLQIDSATRIAAQKEIGTATNLTDKVARLAQFVQTNLTYKAIEFGRRARIPSTAARTIENRYGDCKDHAVLLHGLLKSSGIESHLALIHSYAKVQKDFPSLDPFDHMILYVPSYQGGWFFDCTAKNSDVSESASSTLSGQDALILDASNPRFIRVPNYPTESARVVVKRTLTIENETDAIVAENIVFHGANAAYHRALFKAVEPANWKRIVQGQIGTGRHPAEVEDLKIDHLNDLQRPLTIQVTSRIKNSFQKVDGAIWGILPASWELNGMATLPSDKRQSPFEIRIPVAVESTISIAAPKGYKLPPAALLTQSASSVFAQITSSARNTSSGLEWIYECRQNAGRFSAEEYVAYEGAMSKAIQMLQPNLKFERD